MGNVYKMPNNVDLYIIVVEITFFFLNSLCSWKIDPSKVTIIMTFGHKSYEHMVSITMIT